MAYIARNAGASEKSVVVDTPKVLAGFFVFLIIIAIALFFIISLASQGEHLLPILYNPVIVILILIAGIVLIRMVINAKGIVIDVPENKLTFPGGGVEANEWFDYLKPSFIFQYFDRKSIPLDEIRYIQELRVSIK